MLFPRLSLLSSAIALAFSPALLANDNSATAENLEVIVVSGNRTEQPLKDVAGSIAVQTAEELELQQVTDYSQLFRYDPSIQVTGSVGGAQNFLVRGMGGNRVLLIKDGMRVNEGYGANGLNDIIGRGFLDTSTLKQVEVAKGANSSLYGSDALAGIVVFTTKDPSDYLKDGADFGGSLNAGYADLSSQYHGGVTLAQQINTNFSHMLSGTLRRGEEQQNHASSLEPFDIDSDSLLYKAVYQLNSTDKLSFSADFYQQDTTGERANGLLAYFRSLAQYGYNIVAESNESKKKNQSLRLNYRSEADTPLFNYLDLSLYSNSSKQTDVEYGKLDINAPMFNTFQIRHMWQNNLYEQNTHGLLLSAAKELNAQHQLAYGLDIEKTDTQRSQYEYRTVEGVTTPLRDELTNKFPKNDMLRYGLYVNDTIKLADGRWRITPGLRYDRFDMDPNGTLKLDGNAFEKIKDDKVSFNLGTLYQLTDSLNAYAQYGQGFKVPAYDLAYIEHDLQPTASYRYTLVPNSDLKPETSHTYELGLRGQLNQLSFSTAVFYNRFTNFLEVALIDSQTVLNSNGVFQYQHDTFHYQNVDKVTIKGAELSLDYAFNANWSLLAAISYQDGKNEQSKDYITSISPLSGSTGISFSGEKLQSQLLANWAKRMTKVNDGASQSPGYMTLDWLNSYQLTNDWKVNLAVNNLLDKDYVRYNSIAGHAVDSDLRAYTQPGRNISISTSYQF